MKNIKICRDSIVLMSFHKGNLFHCIPLTCTHIFEDPLHLISSGRGDIPRVEGLIHFPLCAVEPVATNWFQLEALRARVTQILLNYMALIQNYYSVSNSDVYISPATCAFVIFWSCCHVLLFTFWFVTCWESMLPCQKSASCFPFVPPFYEHTWPLLDWSSWH